VGIVLFFIIERLLHWHHHHHVLAGEKHNHEHREPLKPFAYLNLIGEGIHNFLDGTIIAASYLISMEIGFIATIAIVFHEVPQEMGDFGILVHGGLSAGRALLYNFLVALTAVIGALVMFFASPAVPSLSLVMLSIAGGGFLYIALANLVPELQHETRPGRISVQLVFLVLGIALLYYIGIFFPE
jgi:zinc and cadmium transporter